MAVGQEAEEPGPLFAKIATVYSLPEATAIKAVLHTHGIAAVARDQFTLTTNPNWIVALGGIRIYVPGSDLPEAVALLHDLDTGWSKPGLAYSRLWPLNLFLALSTFLLCAVAPPPRVRGTYLWRISADG